MAASKFTSLFTFVEANAPKAPSCSVVDEPANVCSFQRLQAVAATNAVTKTRGAESKQSCPLMQGNRNKRQPFLHSYFPWHLPKTCDMDSHGGF